MFTFGLLYFRFALLCFALLCFALLYFRFALLRFALLRFASLCFPSLCFALLALLCFDAATAAAVPGRGAALAGYRGRPFPLHRHAKGETPAGVGFQ